MIVCRVAASAAEKRDVRRSSDQQQQQANTRCSRNNCSDRRGSTTSTASDISSLSSGASGISAKVSRDRVRMAGLFVNHGADVNMRDARGRTALMFASMNGLNELVHYLLVQAAADYKIQEENGQNSIMFALPFPSIIRIYLDAMDEVTGRPDSAFWRQRTRQGKSIFDLAKESSNAAIANNNSHTGCHKSLQLLTQFITNDHHFQSFRAPPPMPQHLLVREVPATSGTTGADRVAHESRRKSSTSSGNSDGLHVHSLGKGNPQHRKQQQSSPSHDLLLNSVESEDQQLSQMEQSMKRSRSLREFWEKETIDWFGSSLDQQASHDDQQSFHRSSRIPAVVIPTKNSSKSPPRSSRSGPGMMFVPMHDPDSLLADPVIKLPPIASPLIKHEEWRERGHSLNRRTSVTLLRTVNPIH